MFSPRWFVFLALVPLACGGSTAGSTSADAGGGSGESGADATADVASAPDAFEVDASAPWTPGAIQSKLAFWFDPSSLQSAGGGVPRWKDLSGNGNDAVQPTAAYQPTYSASGIGGLPSATFDGPIKFLQIADGPTMQWGTGDFAFFAVIRGRAQTTAAFAMIYQKTGPGPAYDGLNVYVNSAKPVASNLAAVQVSGTVFLNNAPPPSTFIDSSVHLLAGRRAGQTLQIRVDGMPSNALTSDAGINVDINAAGSNGIIGQNGTPPQAEFQQFHGDVAEIVAIGQTLADSDVTNLEQYLMAKYAIP